MLDAVLVPLIFVSQVYYLLSTWCVRLFFEKAGCANRGAPNSDLPPVSIVKPAAKADPALEKSFLTFCTQDYPRYEIVFAISRLDEAGTALLQGLKERFPERNIRWVVPESNEGPNYKVGNLIAGIAEAKYDLVVFSDSDMRAGPSCLRQVVGAYVSESAGIVTCLYRGIEVYSIPDALHSLAIQADFIPNVLLDSRLEGISYAFGSIICTSRAVLDKLGGLGPIREYLADDYQTGYRAVKSGHRIVLAPCLLDHVSGMRSFNHFFLHQLRWAITQRVSRPFGYTASIITHGVSIAAIHLVLKGASAPAALLLALTLALRISSFSYLNRRFLHNRELDRYLWLLPIKDLLNTFIWFLSLFKSTVRWNDRRFRILRGGRMVEIRPDKIPEGKPGV